MIKVFQTIVNKDKGNCMQAAIASLLELKLKEVPNFIEFGKDANFELMKFLNSKDYGYSIWTCKYTNGKHESKVLNTPEFTKNVLDFDGGVNGYFYASVPSQTFDDVRHAVIIDSDMNIVHDPNPNGKALKLKEEDIIDIVTVKNGWYITEEGNIVEY